MANYRRPPINQGKENPDNMLFLVHETICKKQVTVLRNTALIAALLQRTLND